MSTLLFASRIDSQQQSITKDLQNISNDESEHQLEKSGCTPSISQQIQPCFCKEFFSSKNSTDVVIKGTWLYCTGLNLDDERMSSIFNKFLASEINRNYTRRIDMGYNELTKIPDEICQFNRLDEVIAIGNKITSITPCKFQNSTSPRRLVISYNRIKSIDPGAFEGKQSLFRIV